MIGVKCQLVIIIIVLFNLNLQCSQSKWNKIVMLLFDREGMPSANFTVYFTLVMRAPRWFVEDTLNI